MKTNGVHVRKNWIVRPEISELNRWEKKLK